MPVLQIEATPCGPCLHNATSPLLPVLCEALETSGPVIVMIHGFKFAPGHPRACPYQHILSLAPTSRGWKVRSWPRGLGFGAGAPDEGLAIAFGWSSRGTIWQAYQRAEAAGLCLADLVATIRRVSPARPVHIIAHSLGARVALCALPHLETGATGRMLLLTGAEFGAAARAAIDTPAGRATELISVTTRENDLFDFLLERLIPAPERGDRSLAHALPERPNTLTLQLDHPGTLKALHKGGFPVAPGRARVCCHWSTYLREGVFDFYRALLRQPDALSLSRLRAELHAQPEPRWSRQFPRAYAGVSGCLARFPPSQAAPLSSRGITSRTVNQ